MSGGCLVSFHAHPDDEAIFTGGTILRAIRRGWRVVVVVATSGESGTSSAWVSGDDLGAHRRRETIEAARVLGVDQVVFLGYRDSGVDAHRDAGAQGPMPGWSYGTLDRASVLEVAERLHRVLVDERADVLTSYDEAGIYGHRDHVRVHEIARAAILGTVCELVEATVSRSELRQIRDSLLRRGLDPLVWPHHHLDRIGTDDVSAMITVDVGEDLPRKLRAVAAHASQVVEAADFMGVPPGAFHRVLAKEFFLVARSLAGSFAELARAPA